MQSRMTSKEFQAMHGSGLGNQNVAKPQIRLPKIRKMNKTEASFETYLRMRWRDGTLAKIMYEPITFRLPSGTRYTPDFMVVAGVLPEYPTLSEQMSQGTIMEFWEVKGAHIHSSASIRAFKEARAAFPFWKFRFAQKRKDGWTFTGDQ